MSLHFKLHTNITFINFFRFLIYQENYSWYLESPVKADLLKKNWLKDPKRKVCTWGKAWGLKTNSFFSVWCPITQHKLRAHDVGRLDGCLCRILMQSQTVPAHTQKGSVPILFWKLPLPLPPVSSVSAQTRKKCCTRILNDSSSKRL